MGKVELDRDDLMKVLRYLEIIVLSLDRIGSCAPDVTAEEYSRLASEFISRWSVFAMLAESRKLLSMPFDYDELEEHLGETAHWTYANQMPPSDAGIPTRAAAP